MGAEFRVEVVLETAPAEERREPMQEGAEEFAHG
jgi:hypothetical protein